MVWLEDNYSLIVERLKVNQFFRSYRDQFFTDLAMWRGQYFANLGIISIDGLLSMVRSMFYRSKNGESRDGLNP